MEATDNVCCRFAKTPQNARRERKQCRIVIISRPYLTLQNPKLMSSIIVSSAVALSSPPSSVALPQSFMLSLHSLSRTYATSTSTSTTRRSRLANKPPLSLDHFLLRQRVLAFYRTVFRACDRIPSPIREEMREYARGEFERQKDVEDLRKIRYLLSTGKAEFDRLMGAVSVKG